MFKELNGYRIELGQFYFLKQVYTDVIKSKLLVLFVVLLSEVCAMCIWDDADAVQVELVWYSSAISAELFTFHELDSPRLSL